MSYPGNRQVLVNCSKPSLVGPTGPHAAPPSPPVGPLSATRTLLRHPPSYPYPPRDPSPPQAWEMRAWVLCGMGAFAASPLAAGQWIGRYVGTPVTLLQTTQRYVDEDPEYLFQITPDLYLDAMDSTHTSRFFNHHQSGNLNFTVDVEERMYTVGRIPGSFFRREGRPSEGAILTCRLTDRPLRPSFTKGLRNGMLYTVDEIQEKSLKKHPN